MTFTGINYIAVIIAALAGFGLGAIWYRVFAKPWMHAVGKTEADRPQGSAQVALLTLAFVALLIMAWMLAGLMGHLGQVSIRGGVITSFFVWLGFVITTMGVNYASAGAKRILTLIDGGYWLAVLSIQGAIIGAFGV